MTTLVITCRRCGEPFTPDPADIRRGQWRVCPACRAAEGSNATPGHETAPQRPITPATPDAPVQAVTARRIGQHRVVTHRADASPPASWWEWFRRWWDARRTRGQLRPEGAR